jgi:hypothetical protein
VRTVPAPVVKEAATRRPANATGSLLAPPPSEFTPKVKLLVRKRAGRGDIFEALCEACGGWLGEKGGEFQHIVARGMGGCRLVAVNSCAGAALLCGCAALGTGCHGLAEARDPHMREMGFWLPQGTDPRLEPMMLHGAGGGGLVVWRAQDGIGTDGTGYLYQRPEVLAA